MRRRILSFAGMAFGLALAWAVPASAATVTLPPANCGLGPTNNCLIFDNFNVYSMALLNLQAGFGNISPGDPFDVSTNGKDLQQALVIGTGVGGAGSLNSDQFIMNGGTLPNGSVDDAYNTPSASGGGITNFQPTAGNEGNQGSAIPTPPQSPNTWDITVSALKTYLNGGNLDFFFNLNQTNSKTTTYLASPEDALGWMKVTLTNSTLAKTDLTCATDIACSVSFWLDGNKCDAMNGNCDPSQAVPTSIDPNANILPADPLHNLWAYIHGQICASPGGAVVNFGACAKGDKTDITLDQNLGANQAAFALFSQALQDAINGGLYDVMSVDFRMAAETNGYEQLLIFSSNSIPRDLPEPLTITLFGAGLVGMGLLARRRRKA